MRPSAREGHRIIPHFHHLVHGIQLDSYEMSSLGYFFPKLTLDCKDLLESGQGREGDGGAGLEVGFTMRYDLVDFSIGFEVWLFAGRVDDRS
jgi:hypothetical protein